MVDALNRLTSYCLGERIDPITCSRDVHRILDARAKAEKLTFSSPNWTNGFNAVEWFQGGTLHSICHLSMLPIESALNILSASGQVFREMCHAKSLGQIPRILGRPLLVTFNNLLVDTLTRVIRAIKVFGPKPLVYTINTPAVNAASLYTQKDIPASAIRWLYGLLSPKSLFGEAKTIYSSMPGICMGESSWLLALFHAAKDKCPDVETRLKTISRLYHNGGTIEASLLQALHVRDVMSNFPLLFSHPLAFLKVIVMILKTVALTVWKYLSVQNYSRWSWSQRWMIQDFVKVWEKVDQTIFDTRLAGTVRYLTNLRMRGARSFMRDDPPSWGQPGWSFWSLLGYKSFKEFEPIANLADGTYLAVTRGPTGGHAMAYIKDQGRGYLFDPNVGLERFDGPDHWKKVVGLMDRIKHTKLTLMKVEERDLIDRLTFDLPEQIVESVL